MRKFIITYDLIGNNKNYSDLINRIQMFAYSAKINKSSWIVSTTFDKQYIYSQLANYLDTDDSLFVGELNGSAIWINAEDSNEKIKNILNKN